MSDPCEVVVERIALGEPLGDLADHAAGCARCRAVAALPAELGATHRDSDPGAGFAARMTAGAQQRIVVRRRRRVAATLAAAVAVTTLGVFALTRDPAPARLAETPDQPERLDTPAADQDRDDPWQPADDEVNDEASDDDDVRALVELADIDRSLASSAPWRRIEKPLEPYRIMLKGVAP